MIAQSAGYSQELISDDIFNFRRPFFLFELIDRTSRLHLASASVGCRQILIAAKKLISEKFCTMHFNFLFIYYFCIIDLIECYCRLFHLPLRLDVGWSVMLHLFIVDSVLVLWVLLSSTSISSRKKQYNTHQLLQIKTIQKQKPGSIIILSSITLCYMKYSISKPKLIL